MIVHGTMDQATPYEDAYSFAKATPNHKLHVIEGANHRYSEHLDELTEVVWDFIKESPQMNMTTLN